MQLRSSHTEEVPEAGMGKGSEPSLHPPKSIVPRAVSGVHPLGSGPNPSTGGFYGGSVKLVMD